jgi:hypothetical protein
MKDIHIHGYCITQDKPMVKVHLDPQDEIDLSHKNLIELVLPACKIVWCNNNKLTELIIPQGCGYVNCRNNCLWKLIIPDGCEYVYCSDNYLTELIIPKGCKRVYCYANLLYKIYIHKTCNYINCDRSNLLKIIINLYQSQDPVKIELTNNLQLIELKF